MARTILFLLSSKLKKIYIYSEGLSDLSLRYFGVCHPIPPPLCYLLIVVLNIQQRRRSYHYSSCSLILYTIVLDHLYCRLPELFRNSVLKIVDWGSSNLRGGGREHFRNFLLKIVDWGSSNLRGGGGPGEISIWQLALVFSAS